MAGQPETTRLEWERTGPFVPFEIARSRTQHVPEEYIKNAHWGIVDGDESYHVRSLVEGDEHWYPVEFISNRACWVEIRWHENLEQGGHWEAFRIAGSDLGLDIYPGDVDRYVARQLAPRETAPENTTPSRPASPSSRSSSPSVIRVRHAPAIDVVARLAAELRIDDFPMTETQTTTATIREGAINPLTGHMYTNDDVAAFRALQPDHPDPPTHFTGRGFPIRSARTPGGGNPGIPGGVPPGDGGGGGGEGGGGGGGGGGGLPPAVPAQPAAPNGGDKLIGNPPFIFAGDRSKSEEFMADWKKYRRANKNTTRMREPYARATLFLTYIQGGNTTEWVNRLGEWLDYQIDPLNPRRTVETNEWLWNSVELAFNRQFADKLTQERAMAELKAGIKMKGEELDDYISHFEALVRHAGLAINDQLVVDIFTAGLPYNMYKELYSIQPPLVTYEEWRTAAIEQQKRFIHLKGRQEGFKQRLEKFKAPRNTQPPKRAPFGAPRYEPMDTSPGRTRARLAEAEDFMPGGNRWGQAVANPKRAQNDIREVICFNCDGKGHIARNCPQKQRRSRQQRQWQPRPGPSRNRRIEEEASHEQVRAVCDDRTPEQRAQDWLSNIANEQDDVKELVMQQVLGAEGQDF